MSSVSLRKLHETHKPLDDKSGLGFSFGERRSEETCTQSDLAGDKFKKMNFVKVSVIHDVCESVKYDDQFTGQLNHKGKNSICYIKPENCKPSWLTNRLEKDKAKAVPNSSVPNQQRRGSTKAKWVKVQPKRDLNGQSTKPKLIRSHKNLARTLVDIHTGITVNVIQVWVPKGNQPVQLNRTNPPKKPKPHALLTCTRRRDQLLVSRSFSLLRRPLAGAPPARPPPGPTGPNLTDLGSNGANQGELVEGRGRTSHAARCTTFGLHGSTWFTRPPKHLPTLI
ncbi:emp24/gp25L/p24 family of membrane trafficking protein (ISS) [Dorcoceras hygrometricum]|uniref:Emp24/gp25L/p24 family of membrane trafficking protein (ISS) n=1 Tax=Dorcoceras hygrometricum TaxID=472368 RepID=A0A2Z7B1N7_9LAMI|nr:emp24/gp25L/p24 family of membrane trafficking protein (ISS) [Dorcoceras hygrometricum]